MARSRRAQVDTTGTTWTGWDTTETERPTALMMMTTFAGVMVLTMDQQRQLARPLAAVQQPYLMALGVPTACCTIPNRGSAAVRAAARLARRQTRIRRWWAADHPRSRGRLTRRPQALGRTLQREQGPSSHRRRTRAWRGVRVVGRSSGAPAASLPLTQAGHTRATPCA